MDCFSRPLVFIFGGSPGPSYTTVLEDCWTPLYSDIIFLHTILSRKMRRVMGVDWRGTSNPSPLEVFNTHPTPMPDMQDDHQALSRVAYPAAYSALLF